MTRVKISEPACEILALIESVYASSKLFKAPMSLCICAVCTELPLLAHTKKGCRLMQSDFVRSQLIWIYNVFFKKIYDKTGFCMIRVNMKVSVILLILNYDISDHHPSKSFIRRSL